MQFQKKILVLSLAAMLLLTGCGGEPSEAEGAEPPTTPQVTAPSSSDTQSTPKPQEPEPTPEPEINSWSMIRLVNGDTMIAQQQDGICAILDKTGTVRTTLPECTSVSQINPYSFSGIYENSWSLYDLDGTVILKSSTGFNTPIAGINPWGIVAYETADQMDFGAKTITHYMRTDSFEDVYQTDGSRSDNAGILRYDGTQYYLKIRNPELNKDAYFALDGTELTDYQESAPFTARTEFYDFLSGLGYRKCEVIGNGIGALVTTESNGTDIYGSNHELCVSFDSQVQLLPNTPVGKYGSLSTYTSAAGWQTGIYDFQTGTFLLTVEGSAVNHSLQPKVIHDVYSLEPSAFLIENTSDLHMIVCANGTIIENVTDATRTCQSTAGYFLAASSLNADQLMIINVETGEIVSEFQTHLS